MSSSKQVHQLARAWPSVVRQRGVSAEAITCGITDEEMKRALVEAFAFAWSIGAPRLDIGGEDVRLKIEVVAGPVLKVFDKVVAGPRIIYIPVMDGPEVTSSD